MKQLTNAISNIAGVISREAIEQMLGFGELKQTRVYQEAFTEGEQSIILRQLNHRIGKVPSEMRIRIESLSKSQLDELGEALLDFSEVTDLVHFGEKGYTLVSEKIFTEGYV